MHVVGVLLKEARDYEILDKNQAANAAEQNANTRFSFNNLTDDDVDTGLAYLKTAPVFEDEWKLLEWLFRCTRN